MNSLLNPTIPVSSKEEFREQLRLIDVMRETRNADTLKKLLLFSVAMFLIPLSIFFSSSWFGSNFFPDADSDSINLYSGILSIVSVLVIMAAYVILAFNEPADVTPSIRFVSGEDKKTS